MAFLFARKRTTRVTLFAVAALAALPPVFAQTAAPAPYAAAAQPSAGDPPGRVARLNYLSGAVTTEPAGTDAWSYAAVNRPFTTGDQLWDDAGARSELHIGSTAVRLGASTSLSVLNLDDSTTQLKVGLGTLSTHVRAVPAGTSYEIDTPNLALGITAPGDYRVDVAPDGASTTVTVRSGSATVYGSNGQYPLSAGQQAVFTGTDLQIAQQSAAPPPDALDRWAAGRDASEDRSVSARYVSRDIPGYQDLDANGTWRDTPAYGPVWVPNDTPADWAPYHDGHWIWQAPWGWTWVDDAPWGFAPYHYGRWAYVDDRWAWVPGPTAVSAPPAYAPALVAFVGGGDGPDWSVALTVGGVAAAGCAWFALGPGEPWHPAWGGWSPHYYERVNRITVNTTVNVTNVHNTYVNFGAPHAIAAVPATAFVHGQPVARFAQHVDPRQWRNAHVVPGTPGIAPVRQSFTGGLRTASYRPPAAIGQHPFVATRNPAVPAAYRDQAAAHLVRKGEHVPGAGTPIAKTSVPPDYAARPVRVPGAAHTGAWAMRNVQLVNPHGPIVHRAPRNATAAPGAAAPMPAQAGRPGVPGAVAFVGPHGPNGARPVVEGHAMPPAANGDAAHAPGSAQARAAFAGAGAVPHPPATAAGVADAAHGGQPAAARPEPAWMQPHTPLVRQRPTPAPAATAALPGAGGHAAPPLHGVAQPAQAQHAPDARQAPEQSNARREAPRTSAQPPLQTAQIPQPRPDFREPARHAQPQPQPERAVPAPRPQREFAQPAPRHDAAPPRANEFRPPAVAREMPRPQPPAPRMESHPSMPAPHVEQRAPMPAPHIEPRPQPAPHAEAPHPANPPHDDERRRH
ncbi:TPA: hypothetical protein QDB46_004830 [Burkholderia multivorans]|nr:hypothetical protein [Burkholderia multivorans]HDR9295901.1 hypothetical protein [Burkholderia multivorans]HDR9301256.1 hypothetical protein [Burkholderia multivorans]HDR9306799.1 hypothetical protein [Burkholderia multivorans]HDR9312717.1 hypothetical protein [Burkholderia multivorans]